MRFVHGRLSSLITFILLRKLRKSLSHPKASAIHVLLLCLGAGSIKTFNLLSSITAYRDGNLGLGWRGVINYEARGNVVNCCKIATLAVRYSE